jgi:serine/threonine-protein kinase CHEK2
MMAENISSTGFATGFGGDATYMAPEIFAGDGRHGKPVDIWSLGVVLYIYLGGFPPFSHEIYGSRYDEGKLTEGLRFEYPSPEWDDVGDAARKHAYHSF